MRRELQGVVWFDGGISRVGCDEIEDVREAVETVDATSVEIWLEDGRERMMAFFVNSNWSDF